MKRLEIMIFVSALLNIGALLGFAFLYRKYISQRNQEAVLIKHSMENFIAAIEKENEELYQKLIDFVQEKEMEFDHKLHLIRENPSLEKEVPLMGAFQADSLQHSDSDTPDREDEKVLALHKQGFSLKQISKILNIEQGEVELVISILEKKKSHQK